MSLLDKMERKFGRYAIQDLMKYIIILYCRHDFALCNAGGL